MATQIQIVASSENFANADLTFTGDRIHNGDGYSLSFAVDAVNYDKGQFDLGTLSASFGFNASYAAFATNYSRLYANGSIAVNATTSGVHIGSSATPSAQLDVRAQGALSTDVAFRVRNSANTNDVLTVTGNERVGIGISTPGTALHVYQSDPVIRTTATVNGRYIDISPGQGSIDITNGSLYLNRNTANNILLVVGGGSVNVGSGATPGAKLDVRAQGALSTDIAFRVRNSADTANLFSIVGTGTATSSGGMAAWGGVSVLNANEINFYNTGVTAKFRANQTSTNIALTIGSTDHLYVETTGSVVAGNKAALAQNATDGFLYIPTCAGTPTGVPTSITGKVPIVADTTNNKLYVYLGGAWTAMN